MDSDCSQALVKDFEGLGGRYLGGEKAESVTWNGVDAVEITMPDGRSITVEKCLFALGRVANVRSLGLDGIGLELTDRGHIKLTEGFQSTIPQVYAVGDVIGPPSLGSASIDQGRRVIAQIYDLAVGDDAEVIPYGIYTIPEMACCGISAAQAQQAHGEGGYRCGMAPYAELARGQISASQEGFIKLVSDAEWRKNPRSPRCGRKRCRNRPPRPHGHEQRLEGLRLRRSHLQFPNPRRRLPSGSPGNFIRQTISLYREASLP